MVEDTNFNFIIFKCGTWLSDHFEFIIITGTRSENLEQFPPGNKSMSNTTEMHHQNSPPLTEGNKRNTFVTDVCVARYLRLESVLDTQNKIIICCIET